jgi:hypothetical protein
MSLNIAQFREHILQPVLEDIGLYSLAAEELLLGTALQESRLTYLKQIGGGPAVGVFQMEPATHDDIWTNFLEYDASLEAKVIRISHISHAEEMIGNLFYATAMCRVHYYRVSEALPDAGDTAHQAAYWKEYYNTPLGAGTVDEYIANWDGYVGGQDERILA